MSTANAWRGVWLEIKPEAKFNVQDEEFQLVGDLLRFFIEHEIAGWSSMSGMGHWHGWISTEDWPKVKTWLEEKLGEKIDE